MMNPLDADFAAHLRLTKAELLAASDPGQLLQTGACSLGAFGVPDFGGPAPAEPVIETFVISANGTATPTGDDAELNAFWLPQAEALHQRVIEALAIVDIVLDFPAYLTASLTAADQVTTTPHFDDDLFEPGADVGMVAIAANLGGACVAAEAISITHPQPGTQLALASEVAEAFTSRTLAVDEAPANEIVLFPQFGQLHSGPTLLGTDAGRTRNLLVLRARTAPPHPFSLPKTTD
ncbi:MAG: hypothetical protein HKN26_16515 [Acidimicrobiales bacterium]|nr:hypothetical protein [Acidimicrobiales bacterium]